LPLQADTWQETIATNLLNLEKEHEYESNEIVFPYCSFRAVKESVEVTKRDEDELKKRRAQFAEKTDSVAPMIQYAARVCQRLYSCA